ncbi:MAG: heavy metal sensor histidine kinase [Planctomycetia bacterium]|nr:heavy metal sensor histidine kinase [Planctomycetia bacterium]
MTRLSIRWKLTLWYGLVLAVLLTGFSAVVYWTLRHQLMSRIDLGLTEELADVRYEVERAADTLGLLVWLDRRFARHEGFDFQITRPDGTRFFVNERLADKNLPLSPAVPDHPRFESIELENGRWRVVTVQVRGPEGPLTVQVARSLSTFDHESDELLWAFLLAGPLTVAATLVGGYLLAGRTLAPVERITETARSISGERLDQRVPVANPGDELGRLAATLNDMLDRLERSFTEMHRFTADAAHELRTPLAVIRNEAEVALRTPRSAKEYTRVLETLLEEVVRLSEMADQLLFLCRQDAGLNPPAREEVRLDELLRAVAENMRLVAEAKGVTLVLADNLPCTVRGDAHQLRRVFYNLIDNAVKYTAAGGTVRVASRRDGDEVVVTVFDTGIGIPAEHLPRVFDRFYRVDPSRTGDGAGLGLSICRAVVEGAGGTITAVSDEGRGSVFEVRLPVDTP